MAPSSSSSSSKSPPNPPTHFTPIQEEDETPSTVYTSKGSTPKHHPTPLHQKHKKKRSESQNDAGDDASVSCNKCRPHAREKISVVPLDNNGVHRHSSSISSPTGIFKSIISSLTRKSPKPMDALSPAREEQWKLAVAELSHKLIQATRKRDEAVLEASRLKYSMTELEKKLNKLEIYCHNLKSGLDECSSNNSPSPYRVGNDTNSHQNDDREMVEHFLVSVSEARMSVRLLSRSLTMQLRHMGSKVYERISALLQPYDIKISLSKNPKASTLYLEALLNRAFFEDFESVGFQKNASSQILNPIDLCRANYASFNLLKSLTWEEVLNKGTKHFSEEFSRFCDRKMSEIVALLGWNRAWPEPLLQAFFGASKSVWLVHLLANSVHPNLPIFRVDKETRFDPLYMEDMGGDRARKLVPSVVRIMVSPGFFVHGNVIKCKVLCRYYNNNERTGNSKALVPSSSP
ncbi:hypothetical protein UlMin_042624 [Ulmus minor]